MTGRNSVGAQTMTPISVYVVDDVPEMRDLIRIGIEDDPAFEVVGEAGDGRSAIDGITEKRPAAVLLDLSMPDMNGFEAIPEIRSRVPEIAIVVLSGSPPTGWASRRSSRGRTATSRRVRRSRSFAGSPARPSPPAAAGSGRQPAVAQAGHPGLEPGITDFGGRGLIQFGQCPAAPRS
jgi:CheY-like chemotaxis protein